MILIPTIFSTSICNLWGWLHGTPDRKEVRKSGKGGILVKNREVNIADKIKSS